jgi:hypothetical protein
MRRTQACQMTLPIGPEPLVLADLACCVCEAVGVTIVGLGVNSNGAIELIFCSPECAKKKGWPWLMI